MKTGMMHNYGPRPITRLVTGCFGGTSNYNCKDTVCTILDDNTVRCYQASPDNTELYFWFSQGNPIANDEDIIVADYDGNGRDDLMLYRKTTGNIRFLQVSPTKGLTNLPMKLGGLAYAAKHNMQFRAGRFNSDLRHDLIAIAGDRSVRRFDAKKVDGKLTFNMVFATAPNAFKSTEEVTVGRVTNDAIDDIVLHDTDSGAFRFRRAQLSGSQLKTLTAEQGQLWVQPNSQVFWVRNRGTLDFSYRDDALVLRSTDRAVKHSHARWTGSEHTYWYSHTHAAPSNDKGWPTLENKPLLVLKCMFSNPTTLATISPKYDFDTAITKLFAAGGKESVPAFYRDVTYGTFGTSQTVISDWYDMDLDSSTAPGRVTTFNACIEAMDEEYETSDFAGVVVVVNAEAAFGGWGTTNIVLAPTDIAYLQTVWNGLSTHTAAHEVGHLYGWMHSFGPDFVNGNRCTGGMMGEYMDPWDIMGGCQLTGVTTSFTNSADVQSGPGLAAPQLYMKRLIPSHRLKTLWPRSWARTTTIRLAALNRPESNGRLMVRIDGPGKEYHTVEFRQRRGWDAGLQRDAVLVHRVDQHPIYKAPLTAELLYDGQTGDMGVGESRDIPAGGSANGGYVTVLDIDSVAGTATVEIRY